MKELVKYFGVEKVEELLEELEENLGLNGLDYFWSLDSDKERIEYLAEFL